MNFTEKAILAELDLAFQGLPSANCTTLNPEENAYIFFLDLEHGYCVTAGSRIHLFADAVRWAVVFEKNGYHNRAAAAEIELDYVGNCVRYQKTVGEAGNSYSNRYNVVLIPAEEWECMEGEEEADFERIPAEAETLKVRGKTIDIDHHPDHYSAFGIYPEEEENEKKLISYGDYVRFLNETRPDLMQATAAELQEGIPPDLPKLLTLDAFHFSSAYDTGNPPSEQETFQLIATVLATQNPDFWKPALLPNNHWSNWESGNL